jgi:hypothetical protein
MTIPHPATRRLRAAIGAFHMAFLRRPLPDKLALYLHSLNGYASTVEQFMRRFSDLGYDFVGPDEFLSRSGRMYLSTRQRTKSGRANRFSKTSFSSP